MTEEVIPYTRTGPATLNMFAPIPKTNPSGLNSMAGETIEFENPVIGIVEPAPATFPILEYSFSTVSKAPININEMLDIAIESSLSNP